MILEQTGIIEKVAPLMAKKYGIRAERAREIIENGNNTIKKLIEKYDDPKIRHMVNQQWKINKAGFHLLGLGNLKKISSPSKLPEPSYLQIVCIVWLDEEIRNEQHKQHINIKKHKE